MLSIQIANNFEDVLSPYFFVMQCLHSLLNWEKCWIRIYHSCHVWLVIIFYDLQIQGVYGLDPLFFVAIFIEVLWYVDLYIQMPCPTSCTLQFQSRSIMPLSLHYSIKGIFTLWSISVIISNMNNVYLLCTIWQHKIQI